MLLKDPKLKAGLLLFVMVALRLEGAAFRQDAKAILIGTCVNQCWHDTLAQEYSFALADTLREGSIAIRLCSSERSEIAVAKAGYNLVVIVEALKKVHNAGVNGAALLFSRRCTVVKPERMVTEFWAIPRGASLPLHEKRINLTDVSISISRQENDKAHMETLLTHGEAYQQITSELQSSSEIEAMARMLRRDPASHAVVLGRYYRRPVAELRRQVRLAKQELEKDAALKGRFSAHLIPFGVGFDDSVEPTEPAFYVVRLSIN